VKRVVLGVSLACLLAFPAPVGAAIDGDRALQVIRKIASWGQRPAGGAHERRAANFVAGKLTDFGYTVKIQRFTLPNGKISRNAVGRTPGPLKVIVVAHIDGVYNTVAANDNGSGVATMLEVARALAAHPGVLVAGLGAEERHVTGSRYHLGSRRLVRSLSDADKSSLRLALSLDMVGVGPTLNVRGLEAEPNRSARRALAAARALGYSASYLRDTGSSDHAEMTRAGMRAAWVQWRWDPCWHLPCDRPDRISKFKLGKAGRLTAKAARTIFG
jgi:aminopeptidase YwaD